MTGQAFAQAMAALEVNGPEDRPRKPEAPAGWDRIDWRAQEGRVRRLRQRIFKAAQEQDRAKDALGPEWEARFEPRSYGFRPGRGCHDAIAAICNVCKGPRAQRTWALDAGLAAAFGKIDHDHLLAAIGSFPARDMIRGWLKAGVFEAGKGFAPTGEGTR